MVNELPNVIERWLYTDTPHGFQHIEVQHNGRVTWLELQLIKDEVWGKDAIAFEMYPPSDQVVNGESTEIHYRHLFLAPSGFVWPNICPL